MACVYLLHLSEPMSHAQHYIGYADDLDGRLFHHRNGTGARFTQVAIQRGIELENVRQWDGKDRNFERALKSKYKNARKLYPKCSPKANERMKG